MSDLRLRQRDGLYQLPWETDYYQTLSNPAEVCSPFAFTVRTSTVSPRCLGTTKIVFDEYPSTWDTRIPSFRNFEIRSGSGGCDSTKMSILLKNWQCPTPRLSQETTGPLALMHGGWGYDLTAPATDPTSANRALQDAWNRVTQPDLDFGEGIATMAQTLNMILNPLKGIGNLLRKTAKGSPPSLRPYVIGIKKKPSKATKKALAFLENRWLEYRYGMTPLALDISKGIEMYQEQFLIRPEVRVAHGSSPAIKTGTTVDNEYGTGYPNTVAGFRTTTSTVSKTRGCFYHQNIFGDSSLSPNLRKFGLHPSQAANLAWNLLPLSFVVDWVWDVNSFISSLSPVAEKRLFGNTVSWKYSYTIQKTIRYYRSNSPYTIIRGSPSQATGVTLKYKRQVNWPFPAMLLRGADLSSVNRVIDALALTMQNIPRLFRR